MEEVSFKERPALMDPPAFESPGPWALTTMRGFPDAGMMKIILLKVAV